MLAPEKQHPRLTFIPHVYVHADKHTPTVNGRCRHKTRIADPAVVWWVMMYRYCLNPKPSAGLALECSPQMLGAWCVEQDTVTSKRIQLGTQEQLSRMKVTCQSQQTVDVTMKSKEIKACQGEDAAQWAACSPGVGFIPAQNEAGEVGHAVSGLRSWRLETRRARRPWLQSKVTLGPVSSRLTQP